MANPATRNRPESSLNPQSHLRTPITYGTKGTSAIASNNKSRDVAGSVDTCVTSGRTLSRDVMASVQAIQITTAAPNMPNRSAGWLSASSSANLSAMPVQNGLVGPKAEPTTALPTLIASAVIAPKPRPRLRTSSTGIIATISSCIFSRAPSDANAGQITPTTMRGWLASPTSEPTRRPSAPVASSNPNTPPTNSTTRITSAPATMPRGTAMMPGINPTGAGSTRAYVPGTTTERPLAASVRRWYSPAGRIHVSAIATMTPASSRTKAWGSRNRDATP